MYLQAGGLLMDFYFFFKSANSLGKQSGWEDRGVLQPSSTYKGERSHSALDTLAKVWLRRKQCRTTTWSEMNFCYWPKKAREELNCERMMTELTCCLLQWFRIASTALIMFTEHNSPVCMILLRARVTALLVGSATMLGLSKILICLSIRTTCIDLVREKQATSEDKSNKGLIAAKEASHKAQHWIECTSYRISFNGFSSRALCWIEIQIYFKLAVRASLCTVFSCGNMPGWKIMFWMMQIEICI